jgi:HEAT repeat protein
VSVETTLGRRPTLGEVLDYYARDDFVRFLLDTCRTWRVVMVISTKLHWEPNWDENEIDAGDVEGLRRSILGKIAERLPEVRPHERPSYYPSFHQSVWRRPDGADESLRQGRRAKSRMRDCVFEADLPTWRDSFRDMSAILDLMDRHGVRYRHKFSGHRSLHVVLPAEALPEGYRGKGARRLVSRLLAWGGSHAHLLPAITRMPYSLNEDTGLVCLPIERDALSAFRPWQANLHLVEIGEAWQERMTGDDQARVEALLEALKAPESKGEQPAGDLASRAFFVPDRAKICSAYRGRLGGLQGGGAVGSAWKLLAGGRALSEQALIEGLACPDVDARWLTVEAFFLNGTGLSREGFLKLLEEEEEYVRPAATDVLLRFEGHTLPYLVEVISDLDRHPVVGMRATLLLTQSDSLRAKVLEAILRRTGRTHDALITAACLAGAMAGDWPGAFRMLESVRNVAGLSEKHKARLAALDLMSTMGGWDKVEGPRTAQALAALGRGVTDLLLIAAGSPHRRFRRGIVAALAELADERAVDLLIRALGDDYSKVRRKAVAGLVRIGEPAVGALIEATASDQTPVRRYAVLCLGRIGAPRAKSAILQALDDGQEVVRRQALRALQGMATIEDAERLKRALREESWENAMLATEVLAAIGDKGRRAMREMAFEERNLAAAYFIARQGDARGREILAKHLAGEGDAREAAVEYLRELKDERSVPFLTDQLRAATDWHGMFVATELGRIGNDQAVAALIEALSRDNRLIRRGAVRGLAETRDPAAVGPLIRCLEDEDPKVRRLAAAALSEVGESAVAPLKRALEECRMRGERGQDLVRNVLRKLEVEAL